MTSHLTISLAMVLGSAYVSQYALLSSLVNALSSQQGLSFLASWNLNVVRDLATVQLTVSW